MAAALAFSAVGCGGGDTPPVTGGDAGPTQRRLEIQAPGDLLGLAFGAAAELSVAYFDVDGTPLRAAEVRFSLVADATSDPAGSVLSAGSATTDDSGVAGVTVTGGAVVASFRVRVDADNAPPVFIFVQVTDAGFAALHATITHVGDRPVDDFASLDARLYSGVSCADLGAATPPPDSDFPTRSVAFGDDAVYAQLPANLPYTLYAWGTGANGRRLAAGCVELAGASVRAGATLALELPVVDAAEALAPRYRLTSTLDLSAVGARVVDATRTGFGAAACPTGAAQLVLDCAIDALDTSDPLDCVVAAPGGSASALLAARGAEDADGCRAPTLAGGGMSLDGRVAAALVASHAGERFATRATVLRELFAALALDSTLEVGAATHGLDVARFVVPEGTATIDLRETARPVVVAHDVGIVLGSGAAPLLSLASHAFTLRLGDLLAAAFVQLTPQPADGRLGRDLVAGLTGAGGTTGCSALSQVVCGPAGLGPGCVTIACTASVSALDSVLAAPFVVTNGADVDLAWSGAATSSDADLDLTIEAFVGGAWSAQLTLADGSPVAASGSFTGQAEP